ncbi:MAG: hypothetical protein E6J00_09775 [Chloroflexi bacterium]|nr:MAG: hypothetical protein E6J00_09775 [Chloroflexota bacterium]
MGETSAEAKRQVEETRAHLQGTIEALEFKARRNLDVRHQLQSNPGVQALTGALVLGAGALTVLVLMRRRRRSPAERLARRLKLDELRDRLNDFREDARAWTAAQRRIVRADSKSKEAELERRESVIRRLLVSAAEAALTAAAAGLARRLISPPQRSHGERAVMSKAR